MNWQWLLIGVGSVVGAALAGFVALYVSTGGDYKVPETVVDDESLPSVTVNGYQFHAETFGSPENQTVIVLHGGPGGDYRSLLSLKALSDGYFVVFYDQRGAGLSERVPAEDLTLEEYLKDLDAFVNKFGDGNVVNLIGHSWGAHIASAYLGYAPEKVNKTVLAEPGYLNAEEKREWDEFYKSLLSGIDYTWYSIRAGFAAQHVDGPDKYAPEDFLVGQRILPYFLNHPDNPYHCPGEKYTAPSWRFGSTASEAVLNNASRDDLNSLSDHASSYEKPVLFIAGECNTWIGPSLQEKHAKLYPNARLEVISDAGHDTFWDNPEETIEVIRSFL